MTYDMTYMRSLKADTNELVYKTETDSQTQKANLFMVTKGERQAGGIDQKSGINTHILIYI